MKPTALLALVTTLFLCAATHAQIRPANPIRGARPIPQNNKPPPQQTPVFYPPNHNTPAAKSALYPHTKILHPLPAKHHTLHLGIDVLQRDNFRQVAGKRIALLTHPAGLNRNGEPTLDILRRAKNLKLVKLFAPEHGINNEHKASKNFEDYTDPKSGLHVHSLHGKNRKPTAKQLAGIDALLIDLQDIGVRSYTFSVTARNVLEACFENNIEVIILDRPNPLGGLKVDGPPLDPDLRSGVGAYTIPYVYGLTLGELARMALGEPGFLEISERARKNARLTIIPMQGWRREMRWPETRLKYAPTSPMIKTFDDAVAYAMLGLGCIDNGFRYGVRDTPPYFSVTFPNITPDRIVADLAALRIPGLAFRKIATKNAKGQTREAAYIDITDWAAWNPTEISFHLMRLACRYNPPNPFRKFTPVQTRTFNIHVGSKAWWNTLVSEGARADLAPHLAKWRQAAAAFQTRSAKYYLY